MDLFRSVARTASVAAREPGTAPDPTAISRAPEHDWSAATPLLFPVLRPAAMLGTRLDTLASSTSAAGDTGPLIDPGPVDLVVAFAIAAGGFDILVNGDHLAAWAVTPATLRETAFRNLAAWSTGAPWSEETGGSRRILSSDTGDGWDTSRILLPDVLTHLAATLGDEGARVLVGLPARDLLLAGSLRPGDDEFAPQFADFVRDYADGADEAIDLRVFELVAGRLSPFTTDAPSS